MTEDELHDLIASNPDAKAKADAGDDSGAAQRAAQLAPPLLQQHWVTERGVFAAFTDPVEGEIVLQTLEAVANSESPMAPMLKRAIKWLEPSNGGVDLGHLGVRAMLDALVAASVLTAEQVSTLKALAELPQVITAEAVSHAWSRYRPDGKVVTA
jgi:hypothetical protein